MALAQAISQIARIGFTVALARLIAPAEFGLWSMVMVFTGFASLLGDIGVGAALIQRKEVEPRHLDTVFWINMGLGLLLSAGLAASSGLIAGLYGTPALAPLMAAAAVEFMIKACAGVHRVLLVREMNFRIMALQETTALMLSGIAACVLAAGGWGAWSLVAQTIGYAVIVTIWMIWAHPWRPSCRFDRASAGELMHFSLHLQAFNLLHYWSRNLDKFLIGRFLGDASLGQYNRAYTTMLLPQSQISGTLERVLWPALARCSDDPTRLRDAYLRTLRLICFAGLPVMTGMAAAAPDFVRVVFGDAWIPAVIPLQWLCLAGFMQTPISTLGWLYLASGRTRRLLGWSIIATLINIPAIIIGAYTGSIEGLSLWYAVSWVLVAPLAFLFAAPVAGLTFRRIISATGASIAGSLGMGVAVALAAGELSGMHPAPRLAMLAITGVVVYFLLMYRTTAAAEAWHVIRDIRLKKAEPGSTPGAEAGA